MLSWEGIAHAARRLVKCQLLNTLLRRACHSSNHKKVGACKASTHLILRSECQHVGLRLMVGQPLTEQNAANRRQRTPDARTHNRSGNERLKTVIDR